jgi:uncharacterized protein (TIGR03083 family)
MDVRENDFEDMIGAYALDACDADEVLALDAYVASHPEARVEVERLREAAAALGSIGALQPPNDLRNRLLAIAQDRVAPANARAALEAETERFEEVLTEITPEMLATPTENGLTVHELVAHVEAVDRAFVNEATAPRYSFIGAADMPTITAEHATRYAGESFAETVTRFRRTRAELIALGESLPADQRLGGYERDDTLVIRAFETWTHNDDLRRVLGHDNAVPEAGVMRAMAELAMQSLPLAMAVQGTAHADRTARIVLTGPGGGEWTIVCGPGDPVAGSPDVVVTASVVDFCRRFADRLTPDEVSFGTEGDAELGRELVTAANAFAGL